ncbi:MAG TPA: flagellar biosynthesis protein FlhB [Gaiellaceae bacterium]
MADPERTEKPTAKRKGKARREGRAARSTEVSQTAVLLATLAALAFEAPKMLAACEQIMHDGLARTGQPGLLDGGAGLGGLTMWGIRSAAGAAYPVVIAAALAGIVAGVAQVGMRFSTRALRPSFHRLNVMTGLKQFVSPQKGVELAKSLAKLAVVGAVAGLTLWSRLPRLGLLVGLPPGALLSTLAHLVLSIAIRVIAVLVLIAIADLVWQKRSFAKSLRMTKQEVKMEAREADLPPEVRGKIRSKQAEQARKRMLAAVPTADVVVVNPTHFAVALRYDGSKAAPEVVAKGVDHLARRIREVAEEAGVAIVREPPLARALYRDVDLGDQIPEEFFGAVAEVLAFVFRTARRGRRRLAAASA